ncbi:hypothetical protein DYB26_009121, partial [Aphanomyces astaci]
MTQQIRQGVLCKEWQRTPMQLLQEYCRSVKRQPAHYHNAHSDSEHTFRVRCVLSDAKSKDKDLIFCPTQSVDTTLDDAKHCAALLALLHLEPSRPHERKLPDPYREMWLVLQEEQKQPAFKPFKKSAAAAPDASSDGDAAHGKVVVLTSDRAFASKAEYTQSKRSRENRDRANIPVQVFMSQKARDLVESVLADVDNSLDPMGFQPMHIQAVVDRCPDLTDDTSVLDWLCLNVPEDELPKGFNPNGTQLEVVGYGVVAKAAKALEASAAYDPALHDDVIDQLTACGYSRGDCLRALELANAALPNAHIRRPVEHEIKLELSRQLRRALSVREPDSAGGRSVEELEEALDEELMVMESIYDDKCTKTVLSNLN